MNLQIEYPTLGETWVRLVERIATAGSPMAEEGLELLGVAVGFSAADGPDPLLERLGDARMLGEMKKVFFVDGPNELGHSYAKLMRGPGGRGDLEDAIALLRAEPWTKRALVALAGAPNGKVPCINAAQFLARDGALRAMYFARGQDAFKKFYADGACLVAMVRKVAVGLGLPPGRIEGFIGSSHLYHQDMPAIRRVLAQAGVAAGAIP